MPSDNPTLNFSGTKELTEAVTVHALDFKKAKPPFKASYFDVLPGYSTPIDRHVESEIWIILQGSGDLYFEGKIYPFKKNDGFYFPAYMSHQVHNNSDNVLIICSIFW